MADLTDFTVTPMIPIGITVAVVVIHQTTECSFPVALVAGFLVGPVLGVCIGFLLTALVRGLFDLALKISDKRKESQTNPHTKDTS